MDKELERILELKAEHRVEADIAYLVAHEADLSVQQKEELFTQHPDIEFEVLEEITATFAKKDVNKLVGQHVTRTFKSEVKDLGEGKMEAIVSSEALDRHGEQVSMQGMNIKEYMQNPIIADAHDYSLPSVGRTHKLTKTRDGKLKAVFEFAKDVSEKAKLYYDLYKGGFQYAFSIGFMVNEMDGNTFTKSTMIEFSPVLIPANSEALLLAKQKGLDKGIILAYNEIMKYELTDITAKEINDLTVGEINFLKENKQKLTGEQLAKFASVIDEPKKEGISAEQLSEAVAAAVEKAVTPLQDQIKAIDPVKVKDINTADTINHNKGIEATKEQKFLYFARGLKSGNFTQYLNAVGKSAMNTTDDGVVLAPEEFVAEVERLEEQYGVARRFATVRQSSNGNGIRFLKGDDDVAIYDTAEGGVKQSSKNSYTSYTLNWRKFAGILPITDELNDDSAINLFADAANRFARAFAQQEDALVFTESSDTGVKNKGILHVEGTNVVTLSGDGSDDSFADLSYDDLVDLIVSTPTPSQANGRFYFHRTLLGTLMKLKDEQSRPLWIPAVTSGSPATILGKPYELVEVLPSTTDDNYSTPFVIFGDLKYVTLAERSGLNVKIFDSGSVGDPDDEDQSDQINLLTQDAQAMRAVKRLNAVVRFPAAFSILKTGGSGS